MRPHEVIKFTISAISEKAEALICPYLSMHMLGITVN